jgi:site-specific recombinase XerD
LACPRHACAPLGQLVGRYLRWFRNEYGATESTIRDYEAVLARMSLLLADREPLEVSTEDLREVIDTWAMRHARTRAKVTSVIRAFWMWAEEEGHIPFSKIRRPRAPRKTALLLPYPEKRTPNRRIDWADPKKACAANTVHRWWYRMLEQAGLVGHGVRSGLNMHRARHTFATELRRVAGVEAASQALGHSDLSTTLASTATRTSATSSVRSKRSPGAHEADDAASRGNDSPSRLD